MRLSVFEIIYYRQGEQADDHYDGYDQRDILQSVHSSRAQEPSPSLSQLCPVGICVGQGMMVGFQALVAAKRGVRIGVGLTTSVGTTAVRHIEFFRCAPIHVSHLGYLVNGCDDKCLKNPIRLWSHAYSLIDQKARSFW